MNVEPGLILFNDLTIGCANAHTCSVPIHTHFKLGDTLTPFPYKGNVKNKERAK